MDILEELIGIGGALIRRAGTAVAASVTTMVALTPEQAATVETAAIAVGAVGFDVLLSRLTRKWRK